MDEQKLNEINKLKYSDVNKMSDFWIPEFQGSQIGK